MKRLLAGVIVSIGLVVGGNILQIVSVFGSGKEDNPGVIYAAEHPEHPTAEKKPVEKSKVKEKKTQIDGVTTATSFPQKDQLVITGTVFCTSCNLKKQKGAKSQCSVYGCSYALKVKKVIQVMYDEDGKLITDAAGKPKLQYGKDYIGKTYHILANDNSSALLQDDYKGKDVIIVGKIYPDENVVEVDFIKLAPAKP